MPDAILALRQLGVEIAAGDGFSFRGITFLDKETSVSARFPSGAGIGLRRTILHEKMRDRAVEVGVKFLWETPVTGIAADGVRLAGGDVVAARWVVGADGGQSLVRRWARLGSSNQRDSRLAWRGHFAVKPWSDHIEIYWADSAEAYVTPVADQEVCVVVASRKPKFGFATALTEFPELARQLGGVQPSRKQRGAITAMNRLRKVYRGNVALIGDASGSVDAITGEGLSLSFWQAAALADAMEANDLSRYHEAHRKLARRPTLMGRLLLLLDGRPRLRQRVFKAFANHPELLARLLSIHVGETSPGHVATTGAMLGWRFLAG
jgi:flavin-dependent dehydrogenase